MTNERNPLIRDDGAALEARQDRDAEMHEMLRNMSEFLSRYSVDFPLPWVAAETREKRESGEPPLIQ